MAQVQSGMVRFVLVGGREGFSGYLGGGNVSKHRFAFSKGVCTLPFQAAEQSRKILKFYAAYPEGSKELAEAQAKWRKQQDGNTKISTNEGEVRPDGTGADQGSTAQSDGHAEAQTGDSGELPERDGQKRPSRAMSLVAALKLLDPAKDDHWTSDGKPKLVLLQQLLKDKTLGRLRMI